MTKGTNSSRAIKPSERRSAPRRQASSIPMLGSAQIISGPDVRLINISRAGVLLESDGRLLTGSHICLKLTTTDAVFLLKGRVLRSKTSTLDGQNIRYESAIVFDDDFMLMDEGIPLGSGCALDSVIAKAFPCVRRSLRAAGRLAPRSRTGMEQETAYFTEAILPRQSGSELRRVLGLAAGQPA